MPHTLAPAAGVCAVVSWGGKGFLPGFAPKARTQPRPAPAGLLSPGVGKGPEELLEPALPRNQGQRRRACPVCPNSGVGQC